MRDGKIRIRDLGWKKVGSGISIPDPQHCLKDTTSTLKDEIYLQFSIFLGHFCPLGSGSRYGTDPGTPLNPDTTLSPIQVDSAFDLPHTGTLTVPY